MDKINLNILTRYKNFVVIILSLAVCGWGLVKFAVYYNAKVTAGTKDVERINKKLELVKKLFSLQEKIDYKKTSFLKDAREFFSLISSLADNSGIEITSTAQPRQETLKKFEGEGGSGLYKISIDLKVTGKFDSLVDFLNSFKTTGKNLAVSTMEITNNTSVSDKVNVKMQIRGDLLKL